MAGSVIEQPTTPIPCPFPPCSAIRAPRRWLARSDRPDELSTTYPIHDVEGPAAWFGRCPGSQLIVPELTDAGRRVIADALRQYGRRLGDRISKVATNYVATEDDEIAPSAETGPQPVRPPRPIDDYFPGRPADAPEPGVGEQPAKPVPLTQVGQPLGKAAAMSTREELNNLITLTIAKIADAQESCARAIDACDQARAAVATIEPSVEAANALSRAAVGTGSDRPESAEKMAEQLYVASQTVPDLKDAVNLAAGRAEALGGQLNGAATAAAEYLAMPK